MSPNPQITKGPRLPAKFLVKEPLPPNMRPEWAVKHDRPPDLDTNVALKRPKIAGPFSTELLLRVQRTAQQRLNLNNPDILRVSDIAYVRDNELKGSYIRHIAELLFAIEDEIEIIRGFHGHEPVEEDPSSWTRLNDYDYIEGGVYLLRLPGKFKANKYL